MARFYAISTLTAAQEYAGWEKGPNQTPRVKRIVRINGGANLADKNLVTPKGVVTPVSEEDAAFLRANKVFQKHEAGGFVKIETTMFSEPDADKAAHGLEARDASAPDTPADFVAVEAEKSGGVTGLKTNRRSRAKKAA